MYDARRGNTSAGGDNQLVFIGALVGVVLLVFLAVWKGPDLLGGGGANGPTGERARIAAYFPDTKSQDLVLAMAEMDPAGYADFSQAFTRGDTPEQVRLGLAEWNTEFVIANMGHLAYIDMKYLNQILDRSMAALKDLSASGSSWCSGATFIRLQSIGPKGSERELAGLMAMAQDPSHPLYAFNVDVNLIMVEALAKAKRSPKDYGEFRGSDAITISMTVQGLQKSPELQPFIRGKPSPSDIARMDMCKIGHRILKVTRALPDDLKGRIWQAGLTGKGGPGMAGLGMR